MIENDEGEVPVHCHHALGNNGCALGFGVLKLVLSRLGKRPPLSLWPSFRV